MRRPGLPRNDARRGAPLELGLWQTAERLRHASEESLLFLMQARGCYKVGANGVAFTIGGVRLAYGAGSPALRRYVGRDVFITLDPSTPRPDHCYAFTDDRSKFLARLDANQTISPPESIDDLRGAGVWDRTIEAAEQTTCER